MILYQVSLLAILLVLPRVLSIPLQDVSDPDMPFQLTVTPAFVNRMTARNMTLRCQRNLKVSSELNTIFRMRLLKQSSSGWDLIAEQRDNEDSPKVSGNVTALANVKGAISYDFLQASWKTIGDDSFGVFKCDVTGFDAADDVIVESSSHFEVFEFKNFIHHLISMSEETQEKVIEMKNYTDTEFARFNSGLQQLKLSVRSNQSAIEHSLADIETRLDEFESIGTTKLNGELEELKHKVRDLESYKTLVDKLNQWPGGPYALLRPRTGCPADLAFFGGSHAFHKLHTESQPSSDPPNRYSSSAFPHFTIFTSGAKNFVNLEFCEVTKKFNTISWPQGTFCINRLKNENCPSGFNAGLVRVSTESTQPSSDGRSEAMNAPFLFFCCQNSSVNASDPIQLSTDSPFLLYRYGGVCQAVQGMSVSEEYIQINTEDDSNVDSMTSYHPDVDQPGNSVLKFWLCYYQKL